MSYQITHAGREHIKTIADFQLKMALETENLQLDYETVYKGVSAVIDHPELGQYFVVTNHQEVIASLLITYEWSDWRNARVWWIQSVYVLNAYRRTGVFNKMYDHIQSLVKADNAAGGIRLYVDKTNINAQKAYRKVGMNGEHYQLFEWMKSD
jgi:ribosomal protein S18 acetylase RimI-like enzyme